MTVPYTYLLRHKPTGMLYYGVRWALDCHPSEFWVTYFTYSKKLVPLYRTLYGDDCWEHEIGRTFKTTKAAREWEHKVLRRMTVLRYPEIWLNRTDNRAILNEVNPMGMLGKKHSNETRAKMKRSATRGPKPNLIGNKNASGKRSEAIKLGMRGRKLTNEHKANLRLYALNRPIEVRAKQSATIKAKFAARRNVNVNV